jgi:hypothetical protein
MITGDEAEEKSAEDLFARLNSSPGGSSFGGA